MGSFALAKQHSLSSLTPCTRRVSATWTPRSLWCGFLLILLANWMCAFSWTSSSFFFFVYRSAQLSKVRRLSSWRFSFSTELNSHLHDVPMHTKFYCSKNAEPMDVERVAKMQLRLSSVGRSLNCCTFLKQRTKTHIKIYQIFHNIRTRSPILIWFYVQFIRRHNVVFYSIILKMMNKIN